MRKSQCVLVRRDEPGKDCSSRLDELETVIPAAVGGTWARQPVCPRAGKPRRHAPLSAIHHGRSNGSIAARRKRLYQDDVVRRARPARSMMKEKGRPLQPAACPLSRSIWHDVVPLLRQARQGHGGVGQSLLSTRPAAEKHRKAAPRIGKMRGAASFFMYFLLIWRQGGRGVIGNALARVRHKGGICKIQKKHSQQCGTNNGLHARAPSRIDYSKAGPAHK